MGNPVAFFEIVSPDAARARAFYTELFGWAAGREPSVRRLRTRGHPGRRGRHRRRHRRG